MQLLSTTIKREISSFTATSVLSNKSITITFSDIYPYDFAYYEFVVEQGKELLKNNDLY